MLSLQKSHLKKDMRCKSIQISKISHNKRKNQTENLEEQSTAIYKIKKPQLSRKILWAKMDLAMLLYDDSITYAYPFLTPSQAPCCDCCWSQIAVLNRPLLWTTTAVLAAFCALHAHNEYRTKCSGLNLHKGKFRLVKKRSTSLPTKKGSNSSDWLLRENTGCLLQENFVVFYNFFVCVWNNGKKLLSWWTWILHVERRMDQTATKLSFVLWYEDLILKGC